MFEKSYIHSFKIVSVLLVAALLGPTSAYAAKETFERTKIHVNFGSAPTAVELDVVVDDSDGRTEGAIVPHIYKYSDVTLKRGIVSTLSEGGLVATYATQLSQRTEDGLEVLSDLTVQLQGVAGDLPDYIIVDIVDEADLSKPKPEYKYVPIRRTQSAADGGGREEDLDIILFDINGVAEPSEQDLLGLRIVPTSDSEQLRGEPSYLFNTPGPGEDLVAVFPALLPGENVDEELFVHSNMRNEPQLIWVRLRYQF